MAALSADQLAALQQRVGQHPQVQAAIQAYRANPSVRNRALVQYALQQAGIDLPEDYLLREDTGEVKRAGLIARNPWINALYPITAGLSAPAIGSLGVAGATSPIAGGAGTTALEAFPAATGGLTAPLIGGAVPGVTGTALETFPNAVGGIDWQDWLRLGLGGASLAGQYANQQQQPDVSPELRALYDQQRQRFESQNPLYESVAQLAFNRLPTSATAGLNQPSLAEATAQVPPTQTGGNYRETQELRDLLRQQQIRGEVGNPIFEAITRLAASRMPGRR